MGIRMQTAQGILQAYGFEKVYSAEFKYEKRQKGTEVIMCETNRFGAVLYMVSIGGRLVKAEMVMETKMGDGFQDAEYSECRIYDGHDLAHVKYNLLPALQNGNDYELQRVFGEIKRHLKCTSKEWKLLPEADFLDFTYEDWQVKDAVWRKLDNASARINQIWRLPKF